jgi:hypothetical protein
MILCIPDCNNKVSTTSMQTGYTKGKKYNQYPGNLFNDDQQYLFFA